MSCKIEEAREKLEQLVSYLDRKIASASKKDVDGYKANREVVQRILGNVDILVDLKQDKKVAYSVGQKGKFTKEGRVKYATPLIKAIREATNAKFKKEDITYIQIGKYLQENIWSVLTRFDTLPKAKDAFKYKVNGAYVQETNTILYPGNLNTTDKTLDALVSLGLDKLEKEVNNPGIATLLKKTEAYKPVQELISELMRQRAIEVNSKTYQRLDRETVLHELVHALTSEVLDVEEAKFTKEAKALAAIRKAVTPLLMKNKVLAEEDTYWQTDLAEFVSEAISNPVLVRELSKIPVSDKKNIRTVLQAIVDIIAGIFGKHKDTVHDAIMYQLGEIVNKREGMERAVELVAMLKDGSSSNLVTTEDNSKLNTVMNNLNSDSKLNNEYTLLFRSIADELIDYSLKINNDVLIENIVLDIDKIVPGDYSPKTKEIRVVGQGIKDVVDKLIANGTIKELVSVSSNETLAKMLRESKAPRDTLPKIVESIEYKEAVDKAVKGKEEELKSAVFALDTNKVITHELVHAATYAFLNKKDKNGKEKEIEDRLNLLFSEAKKRTDVGGYWRESIHEFVAEAISNPEVIKMLEGMQIRLGSRLTTFLRAIVDAMVAIVSTSKNKENIYEYTLDGVLATMENADGKERYPVGYKLVQEQVEASIPVGTTVTTAYKSASEADDAYWSDKVDKTKNSTEYHNKMVEMVSNAIGKTAEPSTKIVLDEVRESLNIVAGAYLHDKDKVKLATMPDRKELYKAVVTGITNKVYRDNYKPEMTDEEYFDYIVDRPEFKSMKKDAKKAYRNIVGGLFLMMEERGGHAVLHEYVHATAVLHMRDNPDSAATKRIETLFKIATSPRYKSIIMDKMSRPGKGIDDYWTTNVDEFLAEAMSNPRLINALQEVKVNLGSRVANLWVEVRDAILRLAGISKQDSMYEYVVDGFTALMEEREAVGTLVNVRPIKDWAKAATNTTNGIMSDIENCEG